MAVAGVAQALRHAILLVDGLGQHAAAEQHAEVHLVRLGQIHVLAHAQRQPVVDAGLLKVGSADVEEGHAVEADRRLQVRHVEHLLRGHTGAVGKLGGVHWVAKDLERRRVKATKPSEESVVT